MVNDAGLFSFGCRSSVLRLGWQWSVATMVGVVIVISLLLVITIFAVPKFKKTQKQTDDLNRITRESLQGIRIVHAFNAEEYQEQKFGEINNDLTKTHLFIQRIMSLIGPTMSLAITI